MDLWARPLALGAWEQDSVLTPELALPWDDQWLVS